MARFRVVDQQGRPIEGAEIAPVYDSIAGTQTLTDRDGYASLVDSWCERPWFMTPRWFSMRTISYAVEVDYPPPRRLVLRR